MDGKFSIPDFVCCPHCGAHLFQDGKSLYCLGERRHTYDIAKEGYVNLLPPGRAKNARTGDGADMIKAREKFLSGGGYDRYSAEAAALAAEYLSCTGEKLVMIDAGCGEGRHTVNMASVLREKTGTAVVCAGFDASKYGVQSAAKKYIRHGAGDGITPFFAAANIFSLPVSDGCADVFCSLFAPLPDAEAVRVLRSGGVLLICAAGADHLCEMREILYDTPIPSGGGAVVPEGFETVGETVSEYTVDLENSDDIVSLFTMTPFYHNAPQIGRERILSKQSMTVTVQVKCTAALKK